MSERGLGIELDSVALYPRRRFQNCGNSTLQGSEVERFLQSRAILKLFRYTRRAVPCCKDDRDTTVLDQLGHGRNEVPMKVYVENGKVEFSCSRKPERVVELASLR